jgi:outer membrane protein OmpU
MKKVLFATTALVATAGVASADIALSGVAQMGLQGGSNNAETQFVQDIDITFTMSGTADNGLTFGAAIDLDEAAGAVGTNDAGVAIFVSGDFGTLTMGDTDGAFDWALQEVNFNGAATLNDDETSHAGFSGNGGLDGAYDGQILRYDYSVGGFGVAVSLEMDDDTTAMPATGLYSAGGALPATRVANDNITNDPIWGVGLRYGGDFAGGSYTLGVGYQTTSDINNAPGGQGVTWAGISAAVALDSGFSAAVNYSQVDGPGNTDGTHMAIGGSYTFDAITVHANYGQYDWDAASGVPDSDGYGLSASYDFGGGLSAHLGYGYSDTTGVPSSSTWSFGLNMAF